MEDFSWVKPATSNLANLFGLNPEAAAKGRNMQAEYDLMLARTKNTDADTGLSPFRRSLLEAQTGTQGALTGKYKADTGKTEAETAGISLSNTARNRLSEAFASGALSYNQDGTVTISPGAVSNVGAALAAMDSNPKTTMEAIRGLQGSSASNPRAAAQTRGIAASFRPDASFSDTQGQQIMDAKFAAQKDTAVSAAQARGIAAALAKGQSGPDQQELNRQIEAIKEGAEWAMKVPIGPDRSFLNEEQAMSLAQAARAANPTLNVPDAIRKFVKDNPNMLEVNEEWFGNNLVEPFAVPTVVPAPRPTARAGTLSDSFKGAPSMSMQSAPNQAAPAPAAPAAPVYISGQGMPLYRQAPTQTQAAPAAQGMPSKAQFAALPEGGSVVINGVKYVKQGRQLVKAQ